VTSKREDLIRQDTALTAESNEDMRRSRKCVICQARLLIRLLYQYQKQLSRFGEAYLAQSNIGKYLDTCISLRPIYLRWTLSNSHCSYNGSLINTR